MKLEAFDETILAMQLELDGCNYTMADVLGINPDDISYEFATQAARLAWVGILAARAEALYNEAKTRRERVYAETELRVRESLRGEKATEAMVRALVVLDPDYLEAQAAEDAAARDYKVLRALTEAVRQRGDMLVSLGATLRQEYETTGMTMERVKEVLGSTRKH